MSESHSSDSPLSLRAAGGPFFPQDLTATKVLVVDDEKNIRHTLSRYLRHNGYEVVEAANGLEAIDRLNEGGVFLVVTDISMPDMGGIELLASIREKWPGIDVVFMTGHVDTKYAIEAIKLGAFDFVKKPFHYEEMVFITRRAKERQMLHSQALELERVKERERNKDSHLLECMAAFASFIDAKSPFTKQHSDRVSRYSIRLCRALGLDSEQTRIIAFGAKIHDIGKIGIPDSILNKPGPLTPEEREVVKQHPDIGEKCLHHLTLFRPFVCMVCGHHENFDGSGYPKGIPANDTPLEARIVKIADYYDAITSDRPYRTPMPHIQAAEFLMHQTGTALDPELTSLFVDDVLKREKKKEARRKLIDIPAPFPSKETETQPNEKS